MGSVGVAQAAMIKLPRKLRPGMRPYMRAPVTSQPNIMSGPRMMTRDRQCRFTYARGNSTPTANTDRASTIRVNSSVMSSNDGLPQDRGLMRSAPYGPNAMPKAVATMASPA